jgi:hypothetical protein
MDEDKYGVSKGASLHASAWVSQQHPRREKQA